MRTALPSPPPAGSRRHHRPGFALIVTVSILVLLALVAVGLLSLSTLTVRSSSRVQARTEAEANARLALQLAIAELQKSLGDDRRVTANASILDGADQSHALGVWEGWSPRLSKSPAGRIPDYDGEKQQRFLRWMVSGDDETLSSVDWAGTPADDGTLEMFREESDGFRLAAAPVTVTDDKRRGSLAWAVSQEATKAKITVSGPAADERVANDDLQAQPRPSLASSEFLSQPDDEEWNQRATRVSDFNQASLDENLWKGPESVAGGAHFTTKGAGLLTNVVDGGLKVDMSLGFGMADEDFNAASWRGDGESVNNPFHARSEDRFDVPGAYQGQRPLYRPLDDDGSHEVKKAFWPANVQYHFPVTSVPTFHSLRSFYRMPYHLYETDAGLTAFERAGDHVAATAGRVDQGFFPPPSATVESEKTQSAIRPVLDRAMFLVSGGLSQSDELRVVLTPIITLWNPYNVALEIEGSVAHVWIDIPYDFRWQTFRASGRPASNDYMYMSGLMGKQFNAQNHGRSVDPYFFAAITANGRPLSDSGKSTPIRFEPGEVRVFAPAEQELTDFDVSGSVRDRTLFLRPVDSLGQFSTKGGFSIPTRNPVRNQGFVRKLAKDGLAQLSFAAIPGEDYPFYISLEDATRAKGDNPGDDDRGQAVADILANNFSRSGDTVEFKSPRVSYQQLKREPVPIGVLESFHRVARDNGDGQVADLVFTGNPRQPWMNPFITNTAFKTGPQYQIRMRSVSSFNGVLQSANQGRSAFYGASQTPSGGRTHLSFFEVPGAPLLSLAALQHGDFSATPFAPANQVANSWASAYLARDQVADGALNLDHCFLLNEALWDGWFFSGAAPSLDHIRKTGDPGVWEETTARIARPVEALLTDFFDDPYEAPLRNPRMTRAAAPADTPDLVKSLLQPEGCLKIASHLMVDGAFNVNSTSVEAWTAVLSGLRNAEFDVEGTTVSLGDETAFPRFRDPVGTANDKWHGFRTLSDAEIKSLAEALVEEVRKRGPFLSLGEFVNRRPVRGETGLRGALQEAIDRSGLNESALESSFAKTAYPRAGQENIVPNDTAVGTPGYLTQADVLKPLASVITVRSDTFTIRAYGDSRDASGQVLAKAWAEATVQRIPDFVDTTDPAHTPVQNLNPINEKFGRRLKVTAFRFLTEAELRG